MDNNDGLIVERVFDNVIIHIGKQINLQNLTFYDLTNIIPANWLPSKAVYSSIIGENGTERNIPLLLGIIPQANIIRTYLYNKQITGLYGSISYKIA